MTALLARAVFFLALAVHLPLLLPVARAAQLVILSPHSSPVRYEMRRAFSAWHEKNFGEPVDVRWRDVGGGASTMIRFLTSEFSQTPDSVGIDLFFGGGVDPYLDLKHKKLLESYVPPAAILAAIPPSLNGMPLYDPEHCWYGTSIAGFGILANDVVRRWVDLPEARTWEDLTDPRLLGWISSGDPRLSGSILAMYEIILQAYGWEKGWGVIAAMSGNVRSFLSSASGSAKEVTFGEAALGLAIDVYAWGQVGYAGRGNMSYVLPRGVTALNPDSIGLLRGAPNGAVARRFIDFILSRDGQLLWMLPKGAPGGPVRHDINRMSILPALYAELKGISPVQTDPFQLGQAFVYDPKLGAKRRLVLSALLGAVFVDLHPQVRDAWAEINRSSRAAEFRAEWMRPPLSETELLAAGERWRDPVFRNQTLIAWQQAAAARYRSLADRARATPRAAVSSTVTTVPPAAPLSTPAPASVPSRP